MATMGYIEDIDVATPLSWNSYADWLVFCLEANLFIYIRSKFE